MTDQFKKKLEELAGKEIGRVTFDEPLSSHNSWKIGGLSDLFIEPDNSSQITEVLRFVLANEIPLVVIGQGTCLLYTSPSPRDS